MTVVGVAAANARYELGHAMATQMQVTRTPFSVEELAIPARHFGVPLSRLLAGVEEES